MSYSNGEQDDVLHEEMLASAGARPCCCLCLLAVQLPHAGLPPLLRSGRLPRPTPPRRPSPLPARPPSEPTFWFYATAAGGVYEIKGNPEAPDTKWFDLTSGLACAPGGNASATCKPFRAAVVGAAPEQLSCADFNPGVRRACGTGLACLLRGRWLVWRWVPAAASLPAHQELRLA